MSRSAKYQVAAFFAPLVILYACIAFVRVEANPFAWTEEARIVLCVFWLWLGPMAAFCPDWSDMK